MYGDVRQKSFCGKVAKHSFSATWPSVSGFSTATFQRFRDKARSFLREHQDHPAIRKLRENRPLTTYDPLRQAASAAA
jgi:type I site-specific restriction endonuclease